MNLIDDIIYSTDPGSITFSSNKDRGSIADMYITLSLEGGSADADVVFKDYVNWSTSGKTITTTWNDVGNFSVVNNTWNTVYPRHITVKAMSNGIERTDTVMIDAPNKVYAYFEKDTLKAGDTVNIIIKKITGTGGNRIMIPAHRLIFLLQPDAHWV